jgi:hypothetical protein
MDRQNVATRRPCGTVVRAIVSPTFFVVEGVVLC